MTRCPSSGRPCPLLPCAAILLAIAGAGCGGRLDIAPASVTVRLDPAALDSYRASRAAHASRSGGELPSGEGIAINVFTTYAEYNDQLTVVFPVEVEGVTVTGADKPVSEDQPLVAAHWIDNVVTISLAPRYHPVAYTRYTDGLGVFFDRHSPPLLVITSYLAASDTAQRMNRGDRFLWYHLILFIPYVKHIVLLSQGWVAGLGRTGNDDRLKLGDPRNGFRHIVEPDAGSAVHFAFEPFDKEKQTRPRS